MNTPNEDQPPSKQTSWMNRLVNVLSHTPESRDELSTVLQKSHASAVIDDDALQIMEGALRLADQHAGDIMISRSHMEIIKLDAKPEQFLPRIIESGHSRFPVVGESSEDILGILLAKDLIPLLLSGIEDVSLSKLMRPASIIPESKRLSVLLREFREQRYHMAIVVDEYGSVAGLVTIEDILEEIVGDIEDETDEEEQENIVSISENLFEVEAKMEIEDFNEHLQCGLNEEDYDTIGGLIMSEFGHMPETGESVTVGGFVFKVTQANNRRILKLHVSRVDETNT